VSVRELDSDKATRLRDGLLLMARYRLADADAAEEAAQEAMARVLAAVQEGRLQDPARLGAFARGIANHVIVDMLRARSRQKPLSEMDLEPSATAPDPLAELITAEETERLRSALSRLAAPDLDLLRFAFVEGLSGPELGTRLSQPAERIRKRKQRALERLRAAFFSTGRHELPTSATYSRAAASGPALAEDAK